MNRTFTLQNLNRTYNVDDLSWGNPPPPRPYGEPSQELHSRIQFSSPRYSRDAACSYILLTPPRAPPPPPSSPFTTPDQLNETPHQSPILMRPRRLDLSTEDISYLSSSRHSPDAAHSYIILTPPRAPPPSPSSPFTTSDQINETPHRSPILMRPRRLDLSTEDISYLNSTYNVDDLSWVNPPPPPNSPRSYEEPSWEWHSGIQVRPPSPLVPMLPRHELSSARHSPKAALSYIILTPPSAPPPSPSTPSDQLYDTPRRPPISKSTSSSRNTRLRIRKPGKSKDIRKTLLTEEQQKILRVELSETRAKYITALQLALTLEGDKVKVYKIINAKRIEFTTALEVYEQICRFVKKLSQELGPLGTDHKHILLHLKNLTEGCENKNKLIGVKLKCALEDKKECMSIVKKMDKEYVSRLAPLRQRFHFVQKNTFIQMIKLHEQRDITENLRYDIIDEKAKAKAYEDQIKKERLVKRTLRGNVNKMNDQLNFFKQKMGQPISEPQDYLELDSMNEEVSQLMSDLVDEIKVNKELSTLAVRVPPAHIMYIIKRYLRAESYRKALTWQKKFLLLALRKCENTSEYNRFQFEKRLFNAKGLWRVGTNVIIAITRSKNLIRNRGKHHEEAVNAIQQAYVNTVE